MNDDAPTCDPAPEDAPIFTEKVRRNIRNNNTPRWQT